MVVVKEPPGTKRNVTFDETVTVSTASRDAAADAEKKYSLDSDEEDGGGRPARLNVEEVDGQEETTMREVDGQRITPFNLEDEEEEGYFDEAGSFIFNRKKDDIRDSWLDSIDMGALAAKPATISNLSKEASPDPLDSSSTVTLLREVTALLQPGETVAKALKRLGGSQLSASQRLKLRKQAAKGGASGVTGKSSAEDKVKMDRLTVLSDYLLHKGRDSILQDTHEKLTHEISKASEDIFGGETVGGEDSAGSSRKRQRVEVKEGGEEGRKEEGSVPGVSTELNWYHKAGECGPLQGPVSSSEMYRMQQEGSLKPGTLVCKESNKGQFYDAKRIEFDDYID